MLTTVKQACEMAERNKETYGGDWEVRDAGDYRLVIRMIPSGNCGPGVRLFSTKEDSADDN